MKVTTKSLLRIWLIMTAVVFISLDSRFRIPGATILRWVMPAGLLAFSLLMRKGKMVLPMNALYYVVVVLFCLASLYSISKVYSLMRMVSFVLITTAFYNYFSLCNDREEMLEELKIFGICFIVYGVLNAIFLGDTSCRASGITGNPNSLGIWSNISFLSALVFYISTNKKWVKISMLLVMGAAIMTAVLSGSRTYTITIVMNLFVAVLLFQKEMPAIWKILGAIIIVLCTPYAMDIISRLPGIQRLQEKGFGRGELWEEGLRLWRQKPLFGWGYGVSAMLNTPEYITGTEELIYGLSFHNSYLVVLMETGVVGIALVALLILTQVWNLLKTYLQFRDRRSAVVLMIMITMLLCFWGCAAMTSVGSTEGFYFWGVFIWLMVYKGMPEKRLGQG